MKNQILLIALNLITFTFLSAQETTTNEWDLGGTSRLNFSQVNLTNWSAGGQILFH